MKTSKFTEEQIVYALRQVEAGEAVVDVCHKLGISQQTFYTWKKKYGGTVFIGSARVTRPVSHSLKQKGTADAIPFLPAL